MSRAFETLQKLSFVRESATPMELEAAKLIQAECEAMGVSAAIESFPVPYPVVEKAELVIDGKAYECTGIGRSGDTPDEGISGEIVYIHNGQDMFLEDIKGKIVLVTGGIDVDLRKKLAQKGAIGFLRTWGGFYEDEAMIHELPHRNTPVATNDTYNLPGLMIHLTTAEAILKSNPQKATITLKQDFKYNRESRNVVATIEGTTKPEEIIVYTAHFDSVEFSSGAWDNATGSIALLELAHHYQENKPSRTVMFVWCGSEEVDLNGSYNFLEMHPDLVKKINLNINIDMLGVMLGELSMFTSCDPAIMKVVDFVSNLQGTYVKTGGLGIPSTDAACFALKDIPAISFGTWSVRNGATIHSRRDTLEHLDDATLVSQIAFIQVLGDMIVNAKVNPISKEIPKEVKDKKEYWQKDLGLWAYPEESK